MNNEGEVFVNMIGCELLEESRHILKRYELGYKRTKESYSEETTQDETVDRSYVSMH